MLDSIEASLYMFDVGQGDSLCLRLKTGEIYLIDCHVRHHGADPPVLDKLKEWANVPSAQRPLDIELLCLTHPDADHYRGMRKIVDWVYSGGGRIRNLIVPEPISMKSYKTELNSKGRQLAKQPVTAASLVPRDWARLKASATEYEQLLICLDRVHHDVLEHHGHFEIARASSAAFLSTNSTELFILGPTSATVYEHAHALIDDLVTSWLTGDSLGNLSTNEISCVLLFRAGKTTVLLTGDSTNDALRAAIDQHLGAKVGATLAADIVKAPHHGASGCSSPDLWSTILHPKGLIGISAGNHKQYRHPDQQMITNVKNVRPHARLFCTNICPMLDEFRNQPLTHKQTALINDIDDTETIIRGMPVQSARVTSEYHGTCQFDIKASGQIDVLRLNPLEMCPNHVFAGG